MTKSFYTYANFLLGLTVAFGLVDSIVQVIVGPEYFKLESYANGYLVGSAVNLAGSIFILRYYYDKPYQLSLVTGSIAVVASLCLVFVFYQMLLFDRSFVPYYIPALLISLSAGMPYAISLIYSKAGKRPWLKIAGVLSVIVSLILLATVIAYVNTPDAALKTTLEIGNRWIAFATRLLPVLFILNFRDEVRRLETDNPAISRTDFSESLLGFACILALGFTLFFAINIASQAYGRNRVTEKATLLALPFAARTYVNPQGDTLRYRLMNPLDYDPQKKYPLVVCLHHGGTHGTDNIRQVEGSWAAFLAREENRKRYPAFLFAPQCPQGSAWGGVPGYPSVDSLVFATIRTLENEFAIDVNRRYVLGVSGGGYGSWHFITTHPEMFAAAIPICGGGNLALAKNITKVAVWAFHGEKDPLVPVGYSRDMIAGIKKAGGHPRYTEYPGAGHNIGTDVETTPGLLDWFFAQRRN